MNIPGAPEGKPGPAGDGEAGPIGTGSRAERSRISKADTPDAEPAAGFEDPRVGGDPRRNHDCPADMRRVQIARGGAHVYRICLITF